MKTQSQNVLACIDDSKLTDAVCDYSAWIAQKIDAPLELLHTINHQKPAEKNDLSGNIGLGSQEHLLKELTELEQQRSKLLLQQGKLMLKAAQERVVAAGIKKPLSQQRHGHLAESLLELEDNIRVVVLGMEGQQEPSPHLNSQLETVMRSLHRPMLIINHEFKQPERIMMAYDGSEAANKAIDMLANSTFAKGLECHLVCVNKNADTAEALLNTANEKLSNAGLKLITAKLQGKAELELCAYQESHAIDLTIMGAFSHTKLHDLFLGSFTVKMLLNSNQPVLLLR